MSLTFALMSALVLGSASPEITALAEDPQHWPDSLFNSIEQHSAMATCPGFEVRLEVDQVAAAADRATRLSRPTIAKSADPIEVSVETIARSPIDDAIFGRLVAEGITWAPPASDEVFVRRAWLDLAGRIPDPDEVLAFLADDDTSKRKHLLDEILDSDAALDHWTLWLRDLAGVYDPYHTPKGRNTVWEFLRTGLERGDGLDVMVQGLITAAGRTDLAEPVDILVRWAEPTRLSQDRWDNRAANVSQRFHGVRALCISCHDGAYHLEPVNHWLAERKRADLWGLAAFFARTAERVEYDGENRESLTFLLFDRNAGEYEAETDSGDRPPRSGGIIEPTPLIGDGEILAGENRREALARLITSERQFARNIVNRVWARLMVVGLLEPVDDWDLTRIDEDTQSPYGPQTRHLGLIDRLADDFIDSGYDLMQLVRTVASSHAWAMSTEHPSWDHDFAPFFARRFTRRLSAEELVDAIVSAGGRKTDFYVYGWEEPVERSAQLPGIREPNGFRLRQGDLSQQQIQALDLDAAAILEVLGRGNNFDVARSDEGSISQALALLNSALVNRRIFAGEQAAEDNRVRTLLSTQEVDSAINELFLASLSRMPSAEEMTIATETIAEHGRRQGLEDLAWALINSQEFLLRP